MDAGTSGSSNYALRVPEPDVPDTDNQQTPDQSTPSFAELGLDAQILRALTNLGYETPSPIQAETIPALLQGRDVVGLAQTGTGKTAAFALPILQQLDLGKKSPPQALVLAPTRELALQVCEAFESYATQLNVRILPVYGGQGYGFQLNALARGVQIVVGTPGRVKDHLERGTLDLSGLRFVVLDEADEMLTMGFAEDVESILSGTPVEKQVALFSATMPGAIRKLSRTYLRNPREVSVKAATATATNVTHRYIVVPYPQKVEALSRILEVEATGGTIVFVRTKNETETVAEKLRARGFSAAAINGDMVQAQRERTIGNLKSGGLDVLVATDVAARGLDVDRISHVINYDIPIDTESYVHRIGRTGRAGRSGDAISFVTPRERRRLRPIEQATGQTLNSMRVPSADDINASRLGRFDDAITTALSDEDRIGFFRDVVAHYVAEYDVPEVDVAAALAAVMQGDEPMLLDPAADAPPPSSDDRPQWGDDRPRRDRDTRERKPHREAPGGGWRSYRMAVGHRQRVTPRQIVGALTNEGGLTSDQIGRIDIRSEHSLVELPPGLPPEFWEGIRATRISGVLMALERDHGHRPRPSARSGAPSGSRGSRASSGGYTRSKSQERRIPAERKPRHKKRG